MELSCCFKRVTRIISLLLILFTSIQLILLSLDQLGAAGKVFDAELSIGQEAWKYKSKLESGCFCCSGAALIPQRTEALESIAARTPNDALKPRDLARHLLSSLQETQTSLSHSNTLPNHLTVGSHIYQRNNLPPPFIRKVWSKAKGCEVVSYTEDRNATPSHGENVWGMITSDQGWDDEGKEAILVVAMLDEKEGGGLKSWGLGAGLMEWYAKGGGPNSSPLERPLVFLFAQDTQAVKGFLDLYHSKAVPDPGTLDSYYQISDLPRRPKIMAALGIDISTLDSTPEKLEHYGSLVFSSSSLNLKDYNSHILGLASYLASIRSPSTPFEVDNALSSSHRSFVNLVKSWSPVASTRLSTALSTLIFPPGLSLPSLLGRHQIPSLAFHLPRQLTSIDTPFSHSVYSISTLSQVLDSTIQVLSHSESFFEKDGRVQIGWEMWLAGEGLGLGVGLLGVIMRKREISMGSGKRWLVLFAGGLGLVGVWRVMGGSSMFGVSPLVYALSIVTLTSGCILRPYMYLPSFDPLLPWLYFLLALTLSLVVYLPPIQRILLLSSILPFLILSSSVLMI